jgi:hypothetical protein
MISDSFMLVCEKKFLTASTVAGRFCPTDERGSDLAKVCEPILYQAANSKPVAISQMEQ